MAVGLSTTNVANAMLNGLRNTSFVVSGTFIALHVGDPGGSGTSNASALNATRRAATFSAASAGTINLSASPSSWTATTTETISHISVWSASTGGNFLWSAQLSSSKSVSSGDTITLTSCSLQLTPLAS